MTTTSSPPSQPAIQRPPTRPSTRAPVDRVEVPQPGALTHRHRRRPALVLAAVLLLLVSALAGAFAFSRVSTTVAVVGMARTVVAGQVISAEDLTTVQINDGSGLATIPAEQRAQIIGQRAVTDLPAGTTLTPDSVADVLVPSAGRAVIGVLTTPGTAPLAGLVPGAEVLLVPLLGDGQTVTSSGPGAEASTPGAEVRGRVIAVTDLGDGSGSRVDVEVAAAEAVRLQRLSAAKQLSVVIVSKER